MTYALVYLAMALVTAAVGWHVLDRDVRRDALLAIGIAAVAWPAFWTVAGVMTARKIAAGLRR